MGGMFTHMEAHVIYLSVCLSLILGDADDQYLDPIILL